MKWTIDQIFGLAFRNVSNTYTKLNGVIEEKNKLMYLSLKLLKKCKLLPSGIFSIINNSQKVPIDQLAIKNKILGKLLENFL